MKPFILIRITVTDYPTRGCFFYYHRLNRRPKPSNSFASKPAGSFEWCTHWVCPLLLNDWQRSAPINAALAVQVTFLIHPPDVFWLVHSSSIPKFTGILLGWHRVYVNCFTTGVNSLIFISHVVSCAVSKMPKSDIWIESSRLFLMVSKVQ